MADYFAERTFLYYGAASSLVVALAVLSRQTPLIVVSAILWFDWLTYNVTLASWGYAHAPLLIPSEGAMFLGFTILLNRTAFHDTVVQVTAYLFLVGIAAWGTFIATGQQNTTTARLCGNLIYLSQLVVVGGSGAWRTLSDRMARRDWSRDLRRSRGGGVGALHGPGPKASR